MKTGPPTHRKYFLGMDLGGSKAAVMVVDERHNILAQLKTLTILDNPEQTLQGILETIKEGIGQSGLNPNQITAIGVGVPGRVEPRSGQVKLAVNLNWKEVPLGAYLQENLQAPCYLENDVRAAALGINHLREDLSARNLAYMNIGTGIAAGLILNGCLYHGSRGMAGEIGHVIIDPRGPRCQCGTHGCLEALAAGPAIARRGAELVAQGSKSILSAQKPLTAKSIYSAAQSGDTVALQVTQEVGGYLGAAILGLVMTYDVEKVVLGGGVTYAGDIFLKPILEHIHKQREASPLVREMLFPEMIHLVPSDYPAGLWGAVALAEVRSGHTSPPCEEGGERHEMG